jgi:hypothetical protein
MIQLRENEEYYRDTIFWNIYHQTLLFDNLDNALEYYKSCKRNNRLVHEMYTRNGDRVDSRGALDPTPGQGRMPALLKYIYGEMPSQDIDEFKRIDKGL